MPRFFAKGMYGMRSMRGSKPVRYIPPIIYFDNNPITNGTYMDVGSAITHPSTWNNKEGFIATAFKFNDTSLDTSLQRIFSNAYGNFSLYYDGTSTKRLRLYCRDANQVLVCNISSNSQTLVDQNWHTIAASFNTASGSQATQMYIDGVAQSTAITNVADGIVDYDRTTTPPANPGGIDWAVGGSTGGSNLSDLCIGPLVFSDEFVDLSAPGALDLIFSAHNTNGMRNPGNGTNYGLTSPALFVFSNPADTYHINNGAAPEDMTPHGTPLIRGCAALLAPYDPPLAYTCHGCDWGDTKEVTTINDNNTEFVGTSLNDVVTEAWRVPQEYTLVFNSLSTYDYVPQGLYATAGTDAVIYGAMYDPNDSNSIVIEFNTATNTLDKIYVLQFSGGGIFNKHAGGLVLSGDYFIISGKTATQQSTFWHFDITSATLVPGSSIEYTVQVDTATVANNGTFPITPPGGTYYGLPYNDGVSAMGMANDHNTIPHIWTAWYGSRTWILGYPISGDGRVLATTPDYAFEMDNYNEGRSIQGLDLMSATSGEYKFLLCRSAQGDVDWSALTTVVYAPNTGESEWLPALPTVVSDYTQVHDGPLGYEGISYFKVGGTADIAYTWSESGCGFYYNNALWSDSFPYIIRVDITP